MHCEAEEYTTDDKLLVKQKAKRTFAYLAAARVMMNAVDLNI